MKGGTRASQVGSQLREWQARFSRSVWMGALSTHWVPCDLAGTGSLRSALAHDHLGSTRTS